MLLRKLVVVGLVGVMSFAANVAAAQEAALNVSPAALDGVSFADPSAELEGNRLTLQVGAGAESRFANLAPSPQRTERRGQERSYEVSVTARGAAGFDVSLAQRGGVGFDASGDIARESRASELRLGRGLQSMREDAPTAPTWYFFAASEDEALIWRPGGGSALGGEGPGFALQDRVEIGDLQAGITYEAYGVQASLAYVEREFSVRSGARTFTQEERFAGFTLTMRN